MRIGFVFAVFPPETPPAAGMALEMAGRFAARGDEVWVAAPIPSRPDGVRHPGFRGALLRREIAGRSEVLRLATVTIGRRRSAVRRVLENVSFGLMAGLALLVSRRPDVVVVETWPLFGAVLTVAAARIRSIPVVHYVQDLYPEALHSAGLIREAGGMSRSLLAVDRLACRLATRIVVVSGGMADHLVETRRLPKGKVVVIPNWSAAGGAASGGAGDWRKEAGLGDDEFVVLFAGTVGHASGAGILADLAARLSPEGGIRVVCVGDGPIREELELRRDREHLWNLLLLPRQPEEKVGAMLAAANVGLVTTAPRMGVSSVPSKLIGYLTAGRPVVMAAEESSDLARTVVAEGAGWVVPPGDAGALAAAVLSAREAGPAELAKMGQAARLLAASHYSSQAALGRWEAVVDTIAREILRP